MMNHYLINFFKRTRSKHRHIYIFCLSSKQYTVSMNPTTLNKINIIINYISVYRIHKLPVSNIRQKIRLHNSNFHHILHFNTKRNFTLYPSFCISRTALEIISTCSIRRLAYNGKTRILLE